MFGQDEQQGLALPENLADVDVGGLLTQAQELGIDLGIKIAGALAIFIIGRMIARMVVGGIRKAMGRVGVDETLQSFLGNILSVLLTLVILLAAISFMGVPTASFVAVLGAAGLAVGLALQGSLANFASGVLIVFFRPYEKGDYVEAAGVAGSVDAVTIFNTILITPDNRRVVVPNANITADAITNYSANDTRRLDMVIGVGYGDDLKKTKAVLTEVVTANENVLPEPAPTIEVSNLGASSVDFVVRPWVKTSDYWPTHFALTLAIKERLDAEGISIPYPQQDVHLHQVAAD
ncbi:MAG: mechanosensitive ion channel domain-containing protein [Pseudomonadota bacterium]